MSVLTRFSTQSPNALKEGISIIRKVIQTHPNPAGYTTAELFQLALKERPSPDFKPELPKSLASSQYGQAGYTRIPETQPPHPEHPIRSKTFLKNAVLPILEGQRELKIVRTTRIPYHATAQHQQERANQPGKQKSKVKFTKAAAPAAPPAPVTIWVWKPVDATAAAHVTKVVPKPEYKVFGTEVGVGEDWSHLNKRRRRARVGKVRREVELMRSREKARAKLERTSLEEKAGWSELNQVTLARVGRKLGKEQSPSTQTQRQAGSGTATIEIPGPSS